MRRICEPIDRCLKEPVYRLTRDKMKQDGDRVRREPLQDVEEKGDPAKSDEELPER